MAQMPTHITVDLAREVRNITMEVRCVQTEQVRIRFWLATQLVRLAAFVAGVGYEEIDDGRSG